MNFARRPQSFRGRFIGTSEQDLETLSQILGSEFRFEWVQVKEWPALNDQDDVDLVIGDFEDSRFDLVLADQVATERDVVWPTPAPELFRQLCRQLASQGRFEASQDWTLGPEVLRVLHRDQQAGRAIQSRLLPERTSAVGDLNVHLDFFPSLLLSGDFVDYFETDRPSRIMVLLADVAGHGVSSAMVTVVLKGLVTRLRRNLARDSSFDLLSPARTLERINRELLAASMGKHATVFAGIFDTDQNTLTYAVAGHTPMPVIIQNGGAAVLTGKGKPVGLFEEVDYTEHVYELSEHGFFFGLASDGIMDAMAGESNDQRMESLVNLLESLAQGATDLDALGLDNQSLPDDISLLQVVKR